jgi:hypothetical protein
MRTLTIGLLAAAGLAIAIPASAENFSVGVGPNGVGVGVGVREHRDHDWRRDRGEVVVREHARRCRVTIIHRDGMTKRIKRCY